MADSKDHSPIPSWDGSARTWRRYTREVSWFVQSTPVHKRRYCASRLLGKLSGPARLLAMSWSKTAFDSVHGVKLFLQRLAASPLVRRSLPNAAAICQQYFSFRRNPQESIGNFLVRETLVHEEFVEAIIRLHEEKVGVAQEDRDFGLPVEEGDSWAAGRAWDDWWGDWHDEAVDDEDVNGERPPHDEPDRDPPVDAGPSTGRRGDDRRRPPGATGSSPSHRDGGSQQGSAAAGPQPAAVPPLGETPLDELSAADLFILEVLRGWRLLQAAGLNAEEKRDILSTTKNSLDYAVIASALQSLWDDQLLGHRGHHFGQSLGYHHANFVDAGDEEYAYYQEAEEWSWNDNDWWYDDYYATGYDDGSWWEDSWEGESMQASSSEPADPDALAKLQEAQQAEKVAEALAMEANRTWSEAQRATQALRKDRGFGAVVQGSSQGVKRFLCGGNHYARDCPDRRHPGFKGGKSKGKFRNYLMDTDDYYASYMGKGKGNQKGKSKKGMVVDAQAMWTKGKGKSKGKDPYRSVNAYSMDLSGNSIFVGGLEVSDVMGASTVPSSGKGEPFQGMLDSGATASAAPEAVVKGLIEAVLAQDPGARIDLQAYSRPYFRFGNGKWGRALGKTTLSSSLSGTTRQFSLYTLPNPQEYYSSQFDKSTLVPVLIGMDFMGENGEGMIIDFSTGMAMNSRESNPEVFRLQANHKGHLVLDIVHHLTRGHRSDQGQAQVVVHRTEPQHNHSMNQQWLELGAVWFDMTACDAELDERRLQQSRERVWQLYCASHSTSSSTATPAQMIGPRVCLEPPSTSSPSSPGHVAISADDRGTSFREPHQVKAKARPLDFERRAPQDPRDPRAQANQWPCFGQHIPAKVQGNAHGAWRQCAVCNLRLEYIPRKGSPGSTTKSDNPAMITRMLGQLQPLMGQVKPTAAICLAMEKKIYAEETLNVLIQQQLELVTSPPTTSATTSTARPTTTPPRATTPAATSPDRSTVSSWQMATADEEELIAAYRDFDNQGQQ